MNSRILHCVILVNVWAALKASSQFFRNRFSLLLHQRKLPSTSILHHVWRFGKINGAFFLFWASLKKDEFAVYLFFPVMLGSEQFWGEISAKDLPLKICSTSFFVIICEMTFQKNLLFTELCKTFGQHYIIEKSFNKMGFRWRSWSS